jgi:hypothetical protein
MNRPIVKYYARPLRFLIQHRNQEPSSTLPSSGNDDEKRAFILGRWLSSLKMNAPVA